MPSASTGSLPDTTHQQLQRYVDDNCESESQAVNELIDIGLRNTGYKPHNKGVFAANMTSYLFLGGMATMAMWFTNPSRVGMYFVLTMFTFALFTGLYAEEVRNHRLPRSRGEFKRLIRRVV